MLRLCRLLHALSGPLRWSSEPGKLLSIKSVLEEWRNWLKEGVTQCIVWTDHRNLKYLKTTRTLNPHQARWVLFLVHFLFTISFFPGSHNVKADALSCLFYPSKQPLLILPSSCVIGAIFRKFKERVPVTCSSSLVYSLKSFTGLIHLLFLATLGLCAPYLELGNVFSSHLLRRNRNRGAGSICPCGGALRSKIHTFLSHVS